MVYRVQYPKYKSVQTSSEKLLQKFSFWSIIKVKGIKVVYGWGLI